MPVRMTPALHPLVVALALAGCGGEGGLAPRDEATAHAQLVKPDATTAERFGMSQQPADHDHAAGESAADAKGPLHWDAPAGWVEQAPRSMRLVSYQVGESSECYLTLLGGTGGGERANLDRWRGQMGQAALTEEEYAAMPRVTLLGNSCPLLIATGDYQADTGEGASAQGLMGTLSTLPEGALFVKFVGPASEVAAARDEFTAFCESICEGH